MPDFSKIIMNKPSRSLSLLLFFLLLLKVGFNYEVFSQQTETVDFLKIEASVGPDGTEQKIEGRLAATFKILSKTDSIFMDAVNIQLEDVVTKAFKIDADEKKVWFIGDFEKGTTYTADFWYSMKPKQTLYFFNDEIWTQGQGKYTSHWLPSIDDTNDKIEFDLQIIAPKNKTVVANGKLLNVEKLNEMKVWCFDMKNPMSSYLVAFAIGNFDKQELTSNSGIPLELYYNPQGSLKVEPTYRYSKQIFDFLETEIGVPFPWQNYKQVPVRDFLYAGMENTTATFFSEAFMVDSIGFNDRNYINVNAHELAHQWFGNTVTATVDSHHWLQEGFATYYALLAERDIFGDDYYYWQLYQTAEQLKALSEEGKGESLLNPKASSLTFYQKGAWALHILRETIGDVDFKAAVVNYLNKYKYQNVSTTDFLNEVKAVSVIDITKFEDNWLHQSAFQSEDAFQSLMKSDFIKSYFEISALRAVPLKDKKAQLRNALTFPNDFIGQETVYQLADEPISETLPLYIKALESNNLYVRQAVALSLETIPTKLLSHYETLMNDESYVTLENALYQIWAQFPNKRTQVLDQIEGIEGFQNKNIRQLWLVLALVTENYHDSKKVDYLEELKQYTSQEFSFEIRETAFKYINDLGLWDSETLKNLLEACVHPTWRFAKSSKEIMMEIMKNKELFETVKSLNSQVSKNAKSYLISITK